MPGPGRLLPTTAWGSSGGRSEGLRVGRLEHVTVSKSMWYHLPFCKVGPLAVSHGGKWWEGEEAEGLGLGTSSLHGSKISPHLFV